MKCLIVNADDFGFTRDVNEGIVEAHCRGILTASTLMANGEAFKDAVRLARAAPSLDIGCHLVLVGGRSLITGRDLPRDVPALLAALISGRLQIFKEIAAQIQAILDAGIRPTHLDTHKHTHLAPPVLDAVARASREFGIRWVRRPFDFPTTAASGSVGLLKRMTSQGAGSLRNRFHRVLSAHECRTTDHFAGFQITGTLRTGELMELIRALPEGLTEFMCHPGRCGQELQAASTRLKQSRERELEALTAPEVRDALRESGVELTSYRAQC
ncbi:MAG: ChbG/HpnK family deacetylase [Bryobacteraceae bacterium]